MIWLCLPMFNHIATVRLEHSFLENLIETFTDDIAKTNEFIAKDLAY